MAEDQEYEGSDEREAREEEEHKEAERLDMLDAFGMSMAKSRSDSIGARQTSGIEEIWRQDEEFYEGVDDLNRADENFMFRHKPPANGSGVVRGRTNRTQSRVFPNITAPFVDAAAAHISDILLPTEDMPPWSFSATPIPELQELADQYVEENPDDAREDAKKGFLARVKDLMAAPGRNEAELRDANLENQSPDLSPEDAFQQTTMAKAIAEATQTRVWDWQVESQFNSHVRRVIEDASRIGTGILKGPIPRTEQTISWRAEGVEKDEAGQDVETEGGIILDSETKPISTWIDPKNFYPAVGCGQNIQNGDQTWERDFLTTRQLRKLEQDDTYIASQIKLCLTDGPTRATEEVPETHSVSAEDENMKKYEIWYCYGTAGPEELGAAGVDVEDLDEQHIEALVVLVNNRVIKASLPTTDYGGFPYDVFCWRKRTNFWAGIGVGRDARTAQKIVVGATRSMMNNAGLAGGPMIVFKQGVVRPADGVAGLAPRKVFYIAKDDQTIDDARKAIGVIKVDIMVNEMTAIINFGLQMAESNTGFPLLMQGQMGSAPDRVGVVNVLDKNTNAIKRRLARNFSDDVMNPHLRRYYIYHLMYGPDNEKGDLQIDVKGYAALVERDIQNQELGQMYNIVIDPRFGLDPKKWVVEYLKSKHLSAADLEIDDEQWAEMLAGWQQIMESGGEDPRVQVAQINAQARLQAQELGGQMDGSIEIAKLSHDAEQKDRDRQMVLIQSAMNKEMDGLKQAGVSDDVIKKLKVDMAREVMKINSVYRLAAMGASADQLPKPPIEPPGIADGGRSYQE